MSFSFSEIPETLPKLTGIDASVAEHNWNSQGPIVLLCAAFDPLAAAVPLTDRPRNPVLDETESPLPRTNDMPIGGPKSTH